MEKRISCQLGMLRSVVRGTDRMCSTARCFTRKLNLAETIKCMTSNKYIYNNCKTASSAAKRLFFYEVFYDFTTDQLSSYYIRITVNE